MHSLNWLACSESAPRAIHSDHTQTSGVLLGLGHDFFQCRPAVENLSQTVVEKRVHSITPRLLAQCVGSGFLETHFAQPVVHHHDFVDAFAPFKATLAARRTAGAA